MSLLGGALITDDDKGIVTFYGQDFLIIA